MTKTTLTIGLFDKDTERQEIESPAAVEIISNILINDFEIFAFTMMDCKGVYKMNSTGAIVHEPSIRVEIASDDTIGMMTLIVDDMTKALKKALNQESIMVEYSNSAISFM